MIIGLTRGQATRVCGARQLCVGIRGATEALPNFGSLGQDRVRETGLPAQSNVKMCVLILELQLLHHNNRTRADDTQQSRLALSLHRMSLPRQCRPRAQIAECGNVHACMARNTTLH